MKILFDTPEEIQQIAEVIQKHIYPNPLILDLEDLLSATNSSDLPLPWQPDGFHLPVTVQRNRSGRVSRKVRARVYNKSDVVSTSTAICLKDLL